MGRWRLLNNNPVNRNVGVCAVRAVSVALGVDWETAFAMITENAFQMADMPSSNAVWGSVLRQNGFKRYAVPNTCPMCYTLGDFAADHPNGIYVVGTGNHVATIISGVVWDSWFSLGETAEYYWTK